MIPDPHQDDHPEKMLGVALISAMIIAILVFISYTFINSPCG